MFQDEIVNMSPTRPVKVPRGIQEWELERLGGTETIKVDVRIIASTSENLKEMVDSTEFKSNFYSRVNVIPFQIPYRRERR